MKNFKYTLLLATAASFISMNAWAGTWTKDSGRYTYDENVQQNVYTQNSRDMNDGRMGDMSNRHMGRMSNNYMDENHAGYLTETDVKNIQEALLSRGYNAGRVDGNLGAQTTAAVRAFQRDNNLTADGQIHQSTIDRLGIQLSAYEHNNEGTMDRTANQSEIPHYILIEPAAGDARNGGSYDLERNDIRGIQRALMNEGYNPGPADGVWGSRTERAFISFKRDNGLGTDDRITETALNELGIEVREMNMPEVRYESGRQTDDRMMMDHSNRRAY